MYLKLLGSLATVIVLSACTKTKDLPAEPQNKVLSYKVETAEGMLHGAIDESSKTITIYIPFFFEYAIIDPIIELSPGAKLKDPADVVEITEENHTYTVISANNQSSTYTLNIEVQQVKPLWIKTTGTSSSIGGYMNIAGNFNTRKADLIAIAVVDENNVEIPVKTYTAPTIAPGADNSYNLSGYLVPALLDETKPYRIKATMRDQVAYSDPMNLVFGRVGFDNWTAIPTVKIGGEVTVKPYNSVFITPTRVYVTVNGSQIPIPVVSVEREKMVLKIPEGLPLGTNYDAFAEFGDYTSQVVFTVIE